MARMVEDEFQEDLAGLARDIMLTTKTISSVRLRSATVDITSTVNNLGLLLADRISIVVNILATRKPCVFHLRHLDFVRRVLKQEATQALVQV